MSLIIRNTRVVSPALSSAPVPHRGDTTSSLHVIDLADVFIDNGTITDIKPLKPASKPRKAPAGARELDAKGRALIPGLIDAHTHSCWAGSRLDEWDQKRRGVSYLEILRKGGGIMSTVRAVREATQQQLTELLLERLDAMLCCGTTTVEVKSGYGLTTDDELKMLRAIADARAHWPGTIRATALLGHAIDPDQPGFVGITVRQTLPAVSAEFPGSSGVAVDAYCEKDAWSVDQCILLLGRARELGHPVRVHADQFNSLGMIPAALRLSARSVDHLEASTKDDLASLAASSTFGVMLPACGFHLQGAYARGRSFLQAGGALVLATNHNPGSAPCPSIPEVMAIAVRHLGLSPAEALTAVTFNPACLLDLPDRGQIAVGKRADLVLLSDRDERVLAYAFGRPPVAAVIVAGQIVKGG
ncbi:MAG: imidazolonepropionase [Planctomycetaceae bacterium]|nr:imidazolonepropionase [Phycisphaerales bacterium]MCE2651927.1 imidazolonepropionase [Planctomycetaceae bacterium]